MLKKGYGIIMINPILDSRARVVPVLAKPISPIKFSVVAKSYKKGSFWHKIEEDADDYDLCSIDIESDEECPVENPASENSIFYHLLKDIDLKFYKINGRDRINWCRIDYLIEDMQNYPKIFRSFFKDLSPGDYIINPRYSKYTDWEGNMDCELEDVIIEKINKSFFRKIINLFKGNKNA
jgi:hypothetical protein